MNQHLWFYISSCLNILCEIYDVEFNNETTPTLPRYKKVLHCGSTIFGQTRLITNIILYAYFTDFGCADSIVLNPCYQNRRDVSL